MIQTIERNLEECARVVPGGGMARVPDMRPILRRQLRAAHAWMQQRFENGKVRECHGDLHCSNIVRQPAGLTAFDCLEFEPAFRWSDVADEAAFLRADLLALNRLAQAQAFLGGYLTESGDFDGCSFLHLFEAHRSLVRAKVGAGIGRSSRAVGCRAQAAGRSS